MAVDNKFTITYATNVASPSAGEQVGGTSDTYQLHGPYVIDKSYETLRLVFDVVVVGTSYDTDSNGLQQLSAALETAFRKRDRSIKIDIDGTAWTYTHGSTLLNATSSIAKSGDPESDRGFSRAYTITLSAELPAEEADPNNGLREVETNVDYEAGRQKVVTFRGIYTAVAARGAEAQYQHSTLGFAAAATTILTALDGSATWELADEQYTKDRNDHTVTFSRQYVQLLANQSQASLDDTSIRDHRIVFADDSSHPGDSGPDVHRLRRVIATYDCAVDIDVSTDMQSVFTDTVRPHVVALFQTNFSPNVFAVEAKRVGYDETSKRMSVQMTFLYQTADGGFIVEITESSAIREQQNIDYTPKHGRNALAANADIGFAVRERITMRTMVVMGTRKPKSRIGDSSPSRSGWNVIQNTAQSSPRYVGDPENEEQMLQTVYTETIVERFTTSSSGGGGASNTVQSGSSRKPTFKP